MTCWCKHQNTRISLPSAIIQRISLVIGSSAVRPPPNVENTISVSSSLATSVQSCISLDGVEMTLAPYAAKYLITIMSYRKSKSSQNNSNISVAAYICSIIELSCHCSSGERFAQLHQQVPERPGSYRLLVLLPMNSDV
uniref:Uncharacterized protein n=1 Tax=Glossina palpalis gambiensis TaxID=67801 RepID=A0A1B0C3Q0_9MUSC